MKQEATEALISLEDFWGSQAAEHRLMYLMSVLSDRLVAASLGYQWRVRVRLSDEHPGCLVIRVESIPRNP